MAGLDWTACRFAADFERRADGSILLRPVEPLAEYPPRITDRMEEWEQRTPAQIMVARRRADGRWHSLSYRAALQQARAIGAGLLSLGLSAERPIVILSGNSIEHLLLALAAQYVGIPYCPVSAAYSLPGSNLGKTRYAIELLTPGLVAAFGGDSCARAVAETVPEQTPVLADSANFAGRASLTLDSLAARGTTGAGKAHEAVSGATIAKILLTSGSTGQPKAVITTHRMLSSSQTMLLQGLPFVKDQPPVLVDWLPWNHVFGGSHNVGLALCNGGTLYLDDGKPVPKLIGETVRNLKDISPTVYFSVPRGFELLAQVLQRDPELRRSFFRRLRACFFGGAGLAQHTWDALDEQARLERDGCSIPVLSGLGATETAPCVTFTTPANDRSGLIGLPASGQVVKLAPVGDKLELRVKGPNVTPGYWRQPENTARAFDADGYYCLGDAVRLVDPADPRRGLAFDGRIAEDFKLASGTWVSVGPLRAQLLAALAPVAQDVVVAGLNEHFLSILVIPDLPGCARLAALPRQATTEEALASEAVRSHVLSGLIRHARAHPGNATRIERALLLAQPPSLDRGEITDKGSINQRAVLRCRAADVASLYAATPPPASVCLPADAD